MIGGISILLFWCKILHKYLTASILSHDQDMIHGEKGCAVMCNFCMAALMFLTGQVIKAKTHACAKIAYFPTRYIIRTWKALSLSSCASQAQTVHLIGKCVISAQAWVLAISTHGTTLFD